jgi:uncharacterized protein YbjT (DUF2867 family)
MKIVVIGGTGLIGLKVVEKLKQKGHEVIAAAPDTGVNILTGEGLAEVLSGADVVVDVANAPSFDDKVAMDFFQTAGRNITAAEVAAGVKHHLALSVVGTDRLQGSGYFRAKLAQDRLIKASPIPYTLVHATQFFELCARSPSFRPLARRCACRPCCSSRSRPRTWQARWRRPRSPTDERYYLDRRTRDLHARRPGTPRARP